MALRVPDKPVEAANLERQVTVFTTFTNHMDGAVKNLQASLIFTLIINDYILFIPWKQNFITILGVNK